MQKACILWSMLLLAAAAHGQGSCGSRAATCIFVPMIYAADTIPKNSFRQVNGCNIPSIYDTADEPTAYYILISGKPLSESEQDSLYISPVFRDSLLKNNIIEPCKYCREWAERRFRPRPPKRKP